jgi:hypothetical protein
VQALGLEELKRGDMGKWRSVVGDKAWDNFLRECEGQCWEHELGRDRGNSIASGEDKSGARQSKRAPLRLWGLGWCSHPQVWDRVRLGV